MEWLATLRQENRLKIKVIFSGEKGGTPPYRSLGLALIPILLGARGLRQE